MKNGFKIGLFCGMLTLLGCSAPQLLEQHAYLFNPVQIKPLNLPVKIAAVEVMSPFDLQNFWYRLGPTHYLQDDYRGFATVPARQIGQQLRLALNGGINVKNEWMLYCYVTDLYADYRERDNPSAVIGIKFALCYTGKNVVKNGLYKQFSYKERIKIVGANAEALVTAWQSGFEKIVKTLQIDIKRVVEHHGV